MSQQMFEPQDNQQQSQQQKQPGWWVYEPSRRDRKTREMPKNEHPSTFEEPFPTASSTDYQSQEAEYRTVGNGAGEKIQYQAGYTGYTGATGNTQRGFSPDGDAMEFGYRPYNAYQPSGTTASSYAPPWVRPQHNPVFRILAKVLGILLVVALVIKVIIPLLIVLFAFAAIVIVFISLALLVFGVFILGFLRLLGIRVPFRPARFMKSRRGHGGRGRWRHIHFDI